MNNAPGTGYTNTREEESHTLRSPRSVLMVLYYYQPYVSGLSEVARIFSENLVTRGYSVTVLTSRYDNSLQRCEIFNGVTILRMPVLMKLGKGVVSPSLVWQAVLLAPDFDYVCVHFPFAEAGIAACFIEKAKFIPFYHCDIKLGSSWLDRSIEKLSYFSMGKALARADKILVSSLDYFSNSRFSRYLGKAVPITLPIEDHRFVKVDFSPLADKLGLNQNTFLIGFVGRIVREKGLQYLLAAIPYLERSLADFRVIIAGDYKNIAGGSVKAELDHFLLQHPEKIIFTGFLAAEDLIRFYNMIDVLVLPSVDPLEAFGMVQVEAMLCGTPVVASNLPGVREVVRRTEFGLLAEPAQPADIAEKIVAIYRHQPELDPEKLQPFLLKQSISQLMAVWQ